MLCKSFNYKTWLSSPFRTSMPTLLAPSGSLRYTSSTYTEASYHIAIGPACSANTLDLGCFWLAPPFWGQNILCHSTSLSYREACFASAWISGAYFPAFSSAILSAISCSLGPTGTCLSGEHAQLGLIRARCLCNSRGQSPDRLITARALAASWAGTTCWSLFVGSRRVFEADLGCWPPRWLDLSCILGWTACWLLLVSSCSAGL